VYVFERESDDECMVFIFNMTPNFYWDYDIGVPYEGTYEEILNTDKAIYGGWNQFNPNPLTTHGNGIHNQKFKITLKIPSFGAIYLVYRKTNADKLKPTLFKDGTKTIQKDNKAAL
jgi:1,4-alpha-glucan branching enzyme